MSEMRKKSPLPTVLPLCAAAILAVASTASAQQVNVGCGSLTNQYGPYDYTNAQHREYRLPVVEKYHFDIGVQSLKGLSFMPDSEFRLGEDIAYTLRAFPNHHPALYAMIRYYLEKVPRGSRRMEYGPDCWFERARRLAPDDATVVMLEGIYLQKVKQYDEAKQAYDFALKLDPESAEINYNAGLLYADLKEYDQANAFAARAYELGHPLPGLRNKLEKLGVWDSDR